MIGLDWGTSSLRAFRMAGGQVLERRDAARGITSVPAGGFEAVLRELIGDWLEPDVFVLMAGMVGSRQGWVEAPYVPCPAGAAELARALTPVPLAGVRAAIVPGVRAEDADGVPEVMRGEETQLTGLTEVRDGLVCLPGTHSKWATLAAGRVTGFTTHMTGEAFAALRGHTILGRMMTEPPRHGAAFRRGVGRAQQGGGLLHHLFGVRTEGLFGALPEADSASYLSGLLIGHEIAAAAPRGTVHLVGAPALCALYRSALEMFGVAAVVAREDLAATGLAAIAERTV